jgi:quercetin dioxygenase-like cupin family protein
MSSQELAVPAFPDRVRLPLRFDMAAMAVDALALDPQDWIPHFNTAYYQGDWSGAALRAVGGRSDTIYPDPASAEPWADTPLLARCPSIAAALARIECEKTSVRLLRLGPGARVKEHRDHALGYENGECRLHLPVVSGPEAEFVLAGLPVEMADGDCWYVNVNNRHFVTNTGSTPRIHLVVDVVVNDWLTTALQNGIVSAEANY